MSLTIGDELSRLTTCNSATQTYSMAIDLPHMWILTIEIQSTRSLDFKLEMGFFYGMHSALMAVAFE